MSDSRSFIEPFKNRLMNVFSASSSGDDPARQAFYGQERKPRKKPTPAQEQWESESEHLFEDFLSLDEEKITHGLAKAQVRKAMDRKYRRSSHGDQLEQETRALEDTLDAREIDPAVTARKRVRLSEFIQDLEHLLRTRHPALAGRIDLLSRPAWVHLAQQGLPPRFLLNLITLGWYRHSEGEALDNPEALLYLQLQIQSLQLGLRAEEIALHLEKFTLDMEGFESLLSQTLHALERHAEILASFDSLLRVRASQARRYFLQQLAQPWLDPDKRLARYHLDQRFRRLRTQVVELRERLGGQRAVLPEEPARLLERWHGQPQALAALHLLHLLVNSPDAENWSRELATLGLSEQTPGLPRLPLSLEQLEQWVSLSELEPVPVADPGFVSDTVLEQDLLAALEEEDWSTLEKWALLKAAYATRFQQDSVKSLTERLEPFQMRVEAP